MNGTRWDQGLFCRKKQPQPLNFKRQFSRDLKRLEKRNELGKIRRVNELWSIVRKAVNSLRFIIRYPHF